MATEQASGEELERELETLLDQETFEPPEEFVDAGALERRVGLRGGRARSAGLVAQAGHAS